MTSVSVAVGVRLTMPMACLIGKKPVPNTCAKELKLTCITLSRIKEGVTRAGTNISDLDGSFHSPHRDRIHIQHRLHVLQAAAPGWR